MARFISIGDPVDISKDAQTPCICQDDNEKYKESEKDSEPLHPQDCSVFKAVFENPF
jgi:hypothetical protein